MSKPAAWRPDKGQWFIAYVKGYWMHKARGSPFKCTLQTTEDDQWIHAEDSEGEERRFPLSNFRLEPHKKSPPEDKRA